MSKDEAFGDVEGECPICFECPFDAPLQTKCRHVFCRECIIGYLGTKSQCPLCRAKAAISELKRPRGRGDVVGAERKSECAESQSAEKAESIRFDSKLNRLIAELKRIRRERPNEKSLIFTAFSDSLKWICSELDRNGFDHRTLSGSMSMNKRKKQLAQFANDDSVKVFVLTVRAGAVGITLTAANHVFLMEPPLNPALYRQAVNRADRLGQNRKVFVRTLIMRQSVEERIWNINRHKMEMGGPQQSTANMAGNLNSDKGARMADGEISRLFEGDGNGGENEQQ